nr:hypothetical protein [Niallia circulans]
MRYILLVQATSYSEAGVKPGRTHTKAMAAYRRALSDAGILLAAEELLPSSGGIRIQFSPGAVEPSFEAGPFQAGRELLAGYMLIEVDTEEEAVSWARQIPVPAGRGGFGIEVRRLKEPNERMKKTMESALEADLHEQLFMLKRI